MNFLNSFPAFIIRELIMRKNNINKFFFLVFFLIIINKSFSIITNNNLKIIFSTNSIKILDEFDIFLLFTNYNNIIKYQIDNIYSNNPSFLIKKILNDSNKLIIKIKSFEISNLFIPSIYIQAEKKLNNQIFTNYFFTPKIFITQSKFDINMTNLLEIEDIFIFYNFNVYIIIAFLLIVLIFAYFLINKKKKNSIITENQNENYDPYKDTIYLLNNLKKNYNINTQYNELFTKISEIIRKFIKKVYNFNALEKSTSEILNYFNIEIKDINNNKLLDLISYILKYCDKVKFSNYKPNIEQIDIVLIECFNFVNQSKLFIEKLNNNDTNRNDII